MRLRAALLAAALTASGAVALAPAAVSAPPDRRETRVVPGTTGRLVVRYRAGTSAAQRAQSLAAVPASLGVALARKVRGFDAEVVRVAPGKHAAAVRALQGDPAVLTVQGEARYEAFADSSGVEHVELDLAGARALDATHTGAGIEVAIIDTPVDETNPDLVGRVTLSVNNAPADPDLGPSCTAALCPHGTAVATVVGAADDDTNMVGVAPDVTFSSYNVFYSDGFSTDTAVAESIKDVADRAKNINPNLRVLNMSLGGQFDGALIREAITYARLTAPNLVIVVAAGNDGRETANYPAGDPYVISVGASEQLTPGAPWTVAAFSNRGDVDVIAPGVGVLLWYPPLDADGNPAGPPPAVTTADGTSFAAPQVAGMAALLAGEGVVGDRARAALVASAEAPNPDSPAINAVANGGGRADAKRALEFAKGLGDRAGKGHAALFLTRGGAMAGETGRRAVEVLRWNPTPLANPVPPILSPTAGSFTGMATTASNVGTGQVVRTKGTFVAPTITAFTSGSIGLAMSNFSDTTPIYFLHPETGPEGKASTGAGEETPITLRYGSRSTYIKTFGLRSQAEMSFDYAWPKDPDLLASDLVLWLPPSVNGVVDPADSPVGGYYVDEDTPTSGSDGVMADGLDGAVPGRYAIGWVLTEAQSSPGVYVDNGLYSLRLTFPHPGPAVAKVTSPTSSVTTSQPFPVSWAGAVGVTPAARFDVQYTTYKKVGTSWTASPWKPWLTGTTSVRATFGAGNAPVPAAQATTYLFRVRATDSVGNVGPFGAIAATHVPVDSSNTALLYSTGWTTSAGTTKWLGSTRNASTTGKTAQITTDTRAFQVVGTKCAACGVVQVWLDGVLKAQVDTYRATTAYRQVLWSSGSLPGGIKSHSLRLVVKGTAGRPTFGLDAVALLRA